MRPQHFFEMAPFSLKLHLSPFASSECLPGAAITLQVTRVFDMVATLRKAVWSDIESISLAQ